ncbi:hypothetical protein [Bradyrhizobium sp. SZCCHNRI2007]|uniref:hypothetical protein n=1 Tax=Bradyrhizobium sp. SZCCHNRI2007 TaxID=3057281 RepID=UPI0028E5A38D|nr:hypothetical protein [Bradyrhizobium sp. SZCCHNRI2007]
MSWTIEEEGHFCVDTKSARLLHVAEVPRCGWAWAVMDASENIFASGLVSDLEGAKHAAESAYPVYH